MSKRYSIAEARNQLPAIVHDAEKGKPVELTRRGKRVEEGFAAAVWDASSKDVLVNVMGLAAWPEQGWQDAEVWYGE